MFSVTYTGMNFRPLCTASVWPTNSGGMVARRAQVLRTFFWRVRFSSPMRSMSLSSRYGPFFSERPMPGLLLLPASHDVAVGGPRAAARLVALRGFAPRRHRMVALALAFAAAHRMIDRVHDGAAHRRPDAAVAFPSCLTLRHVLVVDVADLPNGRHARDLHEPGLARRQLQRGVVAFLREQLRLRAGAPAHLAAAPDVQLDVVDHRADGDVADRQRVAGQDVGLRSRHQRVPDLETVGRDDVALLAVAIEEQRQIR